MTTEQCCLFLCQDENCGWPNQIPLGRLRQVVRDRVNPPIDSPDVVVLCPRCKRMQIRSLDPSSPYHQRSDRLAGCSQSGCMDFLGWLEFCEESCRLLLPVFAALSDTTSEPGKPADISKWHCESLRCRNGHLIPFPQELRQLYM